MDDPKNGVAAAALVAANNQDAKVYPQNGCHNCKNAVIRQTGATCRARSPVPYLVPSGKGTLKVVRVWPPIEPGDFCVGDYKKKIEIPA